MVVEVASKSPRSAQPGTKSIPCRAMAAATEYFKSAANRSRRPARRSASPGANSCASRAASLKPRNAQKSSQYECMGLAE